MSWASAGPLRGRGCAGNPSVGAGRSSYIRSIALEKPASSNSFSENTTVPSGAISTLHGTQPLV